MYLKPHTGKSGSFEEWRSCSSEEQILYSGNLKIEAGILSKENQGLETILFPKTFHRVGDVTRGTASMSD